MSVFPPHSRCGNVASILELDEHLGQEYKVFQHAALVSISFTPFESFHPLFMFFATFFFQLTFFPGLRVNTMFLGCAIRTSETPASRLLPLKAPIALASYKLTIRSIRIFGGRKKQGHAVVYPTLSEQHNFCSIKDLLFFLYLYGLTYVDREHEGDRAARSSRQSWIRMLELLRLQPHYLHGK
jgi:hypothetical protein